MNPSISYTVPHANDQDSVLDYSQLFFPFENAQKPKEDLCIGIESERFGLKRHTLAPLQYEGGDGIVGLFADFAARFGWTPENEYPEGPIISLRRGQTAITLEPGGQVEFSGSPFHDIHEVEAERKCCIDNLLTSSKERNLFWIASGFHPLATHEQLPWVPKQRYGIMKNYLATQGSEALEMMHRTATVQANFDFENIEDALRKLRVGLRLSPIVSAIFANAPFVEGKPFGGKSRRIQVWLDVDPSRQGLLPAMWNPNATLEDYVDWVLDAPMFMFVRQGKPVLNTGQTFRSFFHEGYEGHRANLSDWTTHLNTMFPEVRLKQTIEVRGADSVPSRFVAALPALWTGIFYDEKALDEAERLSQDWTYAKMMALRSTLGREGLSAHFEGKSVAHLAEKVFTIAHDGLTRRARLNRLGQSETLYLEALGKLVSKGMSPADELMQKLGPSPTPRDIVCAAAMDEWPISSCD
jgi:glutamate--cysteine ligase